MGHSYEVECSNCGCRFRVSEGGGFHFHILRCNKCGEEKSIRFDEIGEPHLQYLKGLDVPYASATSESDKRIQEEYNGESISEAEYRSIVEKLAGNCECGGKFKFDASPRCPECHSVHYSRLEGSPDIYFD